MEYKRKENETDEQLIYRICKNKDVIGTWQAVADILNNLLDKDYAESTYRKSYQAFNKLLETNKEEIFPEDNYRKQLEIEKEQIRKERIKLQTANIERNRLDRTETRREMYYEFIGNVVNTLPLPDFMPITDKIDREKNIEYLLCISDLHYGATFKSINNEYSPEICKIRMEHLFRDVLFFIEEKGIKHFNIACLGDTIQGLLRLSDLKANDSTVVKAVVDISRMIALFLNNLSKYVEIDYYHVPTANHTQIRVLNAKASELADEDFEYIISHYISDLCVNNKRINVHLAYEGSDYINIDILNFNIVGTHGHQIKNIDNALKDLSQLRGEFIEYLIVGHFHSGATITNSEFFGNDTEILVCPSFVGSDPYSDRLFKGGHAAVKIFGFNNYGGHTESYKILLN